MCFVIAPSCDENKSVDFHDFKMIILSHNAVQDYDVGLK